ncbi:hypothetical protein [Nocardia alni]|uniref:hypothetical protein n=1 Tax=Nocardia alni TaxID=2815723 RepID=UPI001C24B1A7|nr:hypothetical protein [Nocardia alni]
MGSSNPGSTLSNGTVQLTDGTGNALANVVGELLATVETAQQAAQSTNLSNVQSLSSLGSGSALAAKFSNAGSQLEQVLTDHNTILSALGPAFIQAEKTYHNADDSASQEFQSIMNAAKSDTSSFTQPSFGANANPTIPADTKPPSSNDLNGLTLDNAPVSAEPGASLSLGDMKTFGQHEMNTLAYEQGETWSWLSESLSKAAAAFVNGITSGSSGWSGTGKTNAMSAVNAYSKSVQQLATEMGYVGQSLQYAAAQIDQSISQMAAALAQWDGKNDDTATTARNNGINIINNTYDPAVTSASNSIPQPSNPTDPLAPSPGSGNGNGNGSGGSTTGGTGTSSGGTSSSGTGSSTATSTATSSGTSSSGSGTSGGDNSAGNNAGSSGSTYSGSGTGTATPSAGPASTGGASSGVSATGSSYYGGGAGTAGTTGSGGSTSYSTGSSTATSANTSSSMASSVSGSGSIGTGSSTGAGGSTSASAWGSGVYTSTGTSAAGTGYSASSSASSSLLSELEQLLQQLPALLQQGASSFQQLFQNGDPSKLLQNLNAKGADPSKSSELSDLMSKLGLGSGSGGTEGGGSQLLSPEAPAYQSPQSNLFPRASIAAYTADNPVGTTGDSTTGAGASESSPMGGMPMGGAGAGRGGGASKEHKTAENLQSTENLDDAIGNVRATKSVVDVPITSKPADQI